MLRHFTMQITYQRQWKTFKFLWIQCIIDQPTVNDYTMLFSGVFTLTILLTYSKDWRVMRCIRFSSFNNTILTPFFNLLLNDRSHCFSNWKLSTTCICKWSIFLYRQCNLTIRQVTICFRTNTSICINKWLKFIHHPFTFFVRSKRIFIWFVRIGLNHGDFVSNAIRPICSNVTQCDTNLIQQIHAKHTMNIVK